MLALLAAASIATGLGTKLDDDWPPISFQRLGTLRVTFTDQTGIDKLCGAAPKKDGLTLTTKGCSLDGKKHIVLENPCLYLNETFARRACHELAHALGKWPNTHPAGSGSMTASKAPAVQAIVELCNEMMEARTPGERSFFVKVIRKTRADYNGDLSPAAYQCVSRLPKT